MRYLFRDHSQPIRLYPSITSIEDPYEHKSSNVTLNPVTIRAIVTDLAFEKVTWAMPGIVTDNAKQIIIQARDLSILLNSQWIEITQDGITEQYEGWKVNGRLQYKREGEEPYKFVRAYIYRRLV
jgi:hypothetical protein